MFQKIYRQNSVNCLTREGSAAFLNEAINQLAEAYISRKEQETGDIIGYENRFNELQKVKMYIADRNVYGIDLNPVAVELAEVSLWLNTIYEGGFVPWFGTQLVNGNSLIGARRQVYRVNQLTVSSKGLRWYENAPERVQVGKLRVEQRSHIGKRMIYHFLLGDPGMASYSDKIIKELEPDAIKLMNNWNKAFCEPYSDDEVQTLSYLSAVIDKLWDGQIQLRKTTDYETRDALSVYGHSDSEKDSHTTIRQKDEIYSKLYKSEHMKNAGPYARLKFAMDYWCSLWFWPIHKAELLPSRSEFLFDMSMILEGTISAMNLQKDTFAGQLSMFERDEKEIIADKYASITYACSGVVDLDMICNNSPRMQVVRQIAEQHKFMHWELEFADLFAERGGFDLIVGNPPWILLGWNEQGVLSDKQPMFAVKKLNAVQTAQHRNSALANELTKRIYFEEFQTTYGQQSFLNAIQNYAELAGMKANLYKCFLPQAWYFLNSDGISAFVHPDSVYDDPKGGKLREKLYPRLRKHYQFTNELKLFEEVHHNTVFSLNVYGNRENAQFESISNLFAASTIDDCYNNRKGAILGIKDDDGNWSTKGHRGRIVRIGKQELLLFAKLFDGDENWKQARLPAMHAQALTDVLEKFAQADITLGSIPENEIAYSVMFDEAADANAGILMHEEHFPESPEDYILSGPNIGVANPFFKATRAIAKLNSDYDPVDLNFIDKHYSMRCIYRRKCDRGRFLNSISNLPWGGKYNSVYRIAMRRMLNISGERTLMPTIITPGTSHINGVYSIALTQKLSVLAGCMASVPFDFYIKITGKTNGGYNIYSAFPMFDNSRYASSIMIRTLLLNCLTEAYSDIWKKEFETLRPEEGWSKIDARLVQDTYSGLTNKWDFEKVLRGEFERRQALVEIDVLTAMALGMTLEQLKTIYRIQFPVLQSYEADTWYDANGRIVFTNNRSLIGVGFDRKQFELEIKDAPAGKKFYRTIMDDTMPGGPVERTIEYVAPFDRCDREKDYETAWKFFEEKYGGPE